MTTAKLRPIDAILLITLVIITILGAVFPFDKVWKPSMISEYAPVASWNLTICSWHWISAAISLLIGYFKGRVLVTVFSILFLLFFSVIYHFYGAGSITGDFHPLSGFYLTATAWLGFAVHSYFLAFRK